jgi:hypothetical protein
MKEKKEKGFLHSARTQHNTTQKRPKPPKTPKARKILHAPTPKKLNHGCVRTVERFNQSFSAQ